MNKFPIIVSGLVDSREVLGKSSIIALILSVFHLVMKTMQFTVLLVMLTKSFGGVFFWLFAATISQLYLPCLHPRPEFVLFNWCKLEHLSFYNKGRKEKIES